MLGQYETAIIVALTVGALAAVVTYLIKRKRRDEVDSDRLALALVEGTATPPSLYPLIDANKCIGSLSCVSACPEGDILGLVSGRAALVAGSHCIGHSRCATECPVDAIQLVFGSKKMGVDLPETDGSFESSRKGVYIIGELGGMGLIKNALRQGIEVSEVLAKKIKRTSSSPHVVDVVIVGSGPAGLATALGCRAAGLSFRVLEQGIIGGTVAHYPRGKVVMTEAVDLPIYGRFGRSLLSKEELLDAFSGIIKTGKIVIEENTKVTGLEGKNGDFSVITSRGRITGHAVVLATGLRGSPRQLGVPGDDHHKVHYSLIDTTQFVGKKVLIVGGGDSAVEAAIQLVEETDAKVTISYRKSTFARAKPRNRKRIAELIAEKRIQAFMESNIQRVLDDKVALSLADGRQGAIGNDAVIACLGGEQPAKFLKSVGVSMRTYAGHEKGDGEERKRGQRKNRHLGFIFVLLGIAITAMLAFAGGEYYFLPLDARPDHPLHEFLRPAGLWGHSVGIIATLFMMSNFIYVLRKRWRALKASAPIRTWLTMHMFVGIMSPMVIAFHAAFQFGNGLAVITWIALGIVVSTGIFGRFLFGFVPASDGKLESQSDLSERLSSFVELLKPMMQHAQQGAHLQELVDFALEKPGDLGMFGTIRYARHQKRYLKHALANVASAFGDSHNFVEFRDTILQVSRLHWQVALYGRIKRLFRLWLALHVVLALTMVVLIALHIAVTIFLGYTWIFT